MTVYVKDPETGKLLPRDKVERRQARQAAKKAYTYEDRVVERGRWVWKDGESIPAHEFYEARPEVNAPMVIGEIREYLSPIDGTQITSRQAHRDHMKRHGVVEIGNEVQKREPKKLRDPRYTVKESLEKLRAGHPAAKAEKARPDIEGDGLRIVG